MSCVMYSSCEKLPFTIFQTCIIEHDLRGLVISGSAEPEQIAAAWRGIFAEYLDLISIHNGKADLSAKIQAQNLAIKIGYVSSSMALLRKVCIPQLAMDLKKDYPRLKLDPFGPDEQYQKDLNRIDALLKADTIRLGILREQLEPAGAAKADPYTYSYFDDVFAEISKYEGYRLTAGMVSTSQYCTHIRRLNSHIESMNRQIQKANAR